MKRTFFIPMAALVLLAACSENSPNMTENNQLRSGAGGNTANPKYSSSSYTFVASTKGLNHSWRQTGLGSFTNVEYVLTADANITAHCENKGNNTVAGAPFQITQPLASEPTSFPQRNGAINGTLTLTPQSVVCQPPGGNPHEAIIDNVLYFNIKFCWGKSDVSTEALQGPIPGGPGSEDTVPPNATGSPLTGDQGGQTQAELGIFATCVSTAP